MISCKEAVGLNNKIGTCWNVAIQTNLFYGHNSDIIQQKLSENSLEKLLNPTVIENLERFLPPFLLDDNGKLLQRSLDIIKKIVINLKKRFDIKNKQKLTKMRNAEEDICERDFVYYTFELIHPGQRDKKDKDGWGGYFYDSFFLTNILDIILLNKLTHTVRYYLDYLSKGNKISLNIDKIKNIVVSLYLSDIPLDITDLTVKSNNHACQFFECGGTTKFSNNDTIIEHDWRMFFKILNMLSVSDYEQQKNDSGFPLFSDYDTKPNPLPKYQIWENLEIGPYIVTYDSELKPSIMYSFSPFFKIEKIINPTSIIAEGQVILFHFSYNIGCTHENIKQLIGLNVEHYLSLDMMKNNILMAQRLLDRMDVNIIDKEKDTVIMKGVRIENILFVKEALKRINKTTLNYQNKIGRTALMIALSIKNKHLIKEIMNYRPNLELNDYKGVNAYYYGKYFGTDLNDLSGLTTPTYQYLQTAIYKDDLSGVKSLLNELNDINETGAGDITILMYSLGNTNNLEIIKAILKKNPDISLKDIDGNTALDIAKDFDSSDDIIELLESYKPVSVKPSSVKPPLLKPISSFNPQVKPVKPVKPVIMEPIKEENSKEFKKLIKAIDKENLFEVKSLLDKLKDINETDKEFGMTLLMSAFTGLPNFKIIKEILKKNPDLSIKNSDGETALDIAKMYNNNILVKKLLQGDLTIEESEENKLRELKRTVDLSIDNENLSNLELLLDDLKDINKIDDHQTLLLYAVSSIDNVEIIKAILKKNPDISIKNSHGETALDIAKHYKLERIVKLLEEYQSKAVNVKSVNVRPINVKPKTNIKNVIF